VLICGSDSDNLAELCQHELKRLLLLV
jgi:hypothetical protein